MKHRIIFILILGLFAISLGLKPQQEAQYFVQFRVNTISDNAQAMAVDQKMNNKSGIESSRTDYKTSTYFCTLKSGADYSEDDFTNWFENLGYAISCFHKGVQGVDHVLSPHELKDCVDEE